MPLPIGDARRQGALTQLAPDRSNSTCLARRASPARCAMRNTPRAPVLATLTPVHAAYLRPPPNSALPEAWGRRRCQFRTGCQPAADRDGWPQLPQGARSVRALARVLSSLPCCSCALMKVLLLLCSLEALVALSKLWLLCSCPCLPCRIVALLVSRSASSAGSAAA